MAKIKKVRVYSFTGSKNGVMGSISITAKNLDAAEKIRWELHESPVSGIECHGYVGAMHGGGQWVPENEVRPFVSEDQAELEHRRAHPENYVMVPVRNAMTGEMTTERADTPFSLSVGSEGYWAS